MSIVNRFKPISISLSPNVQKDDVKLALKLLFQPWEWKKRKAIKELEESFKNYLDVKYAYSFNSGRSALYAILKALDLPANSDVFLQTFTCNAVPNPILWAGLNLIYIDCDKENFNIEIEDLKSKIDALILTNKGYTNVKRCVLVIQHTFGLPANMVKIMELAKQHNIIVIEDCAHALGTTYNGKKVGVFGKAAFFSFSRDKVISCIYGGMAVTNDDEIGKNLEKLQKEFRIPSYYWIAQQLWHPILIHYVVLPFYKFFDIGKIFLVLSQWVKFLSKAVSWREKRGLKPRYFPKALPNALAILAKNQLNKLEKFNEHRRKISSFYYENLKDTSFKMPNMSKEQNFLRFSVQHPKAHQIIYTAWHQENILLGDWYTSPIAPEDTDLEKMKYKKGQCPNAESLSETTLNLPTHINISLGDAKRIVEFLKREQMK